MFRMLEVLLIAMVTTSAVFVVAMLLGSCMVNKNKTMANENPDYVRSYV